MLKLCFQLVLALGAVLGAGAGFAGPPLSPQQQQLLNTHVRPNLPTQTQIRWTTLDKGDVTLRLSEGKLDESFRWTVAGQSLSVDEYLERQPVTGLLIAKDGVLVYERYQYTASATSLFQSNSMAKSVTGIGFGLMRQQGLLPDFDVPADKYLPGLADSNLGRVTVRNLLRMSAGLRYVETYQPGDDNAVFGRTMGTQGLGAALATIRNNEQATPQGTQFHYGSYQSAVLGMVAQQVTGKNMARYIEQNLWRGLGMEAQAAWAETRDGYTMGQSNLLARGRDWLRLGVVLAHGGKRPDSGAEVIPARFIDDTINAAALEPAFRPRADGWGYENQFWLAGRPTREYGMLGIYGQSIFISQKLNLVMVQFAVAPQASLAGTSLARERTALWRALVRFYDR